MEKSKSKFSSLASKKADLYQQITDRIIIALENGVPPWRKPWRNVSRSNIEGLPVNAVTRKQYSGINILVLWMSAEENGYRNPYWLTYLQAQKLGGQVRKGEKATTAVVYKDWTKQAEDVDGNRIYDDEGKPLMETVPMLRPLQLFNAEQCDDLPDDIVRTTEITPSVNEEGIVSSQVLDSIITIANSTGVTHSMRPQNRAYYRPMSDEIVMPMPEQFFSEEDWASTLLHELVHSTGHKKRLNRVGITSATRKFGDEIYAFEELIAEMGSAFLCAQLGIFGDIQHDSYVDSWLKVLKSDKKALFRACSKAREASEYLLSHQSPIDAVASK